jgi:flagellar biosynthesis protein FliR
MDLDAANWMFVFVRASAFLLVLPVFSTPGIPVRVRVALSAALAFLISPLLPQFSSRSASFGLWLGWFVLEALTGLCLGFVTRMVFYAADFAGRLIANEMGLNMASTFDPLTGGQNQVPGTILFFFAVTILMTLDMHHWLLLGFQQSYQLVPVGGARLREALLAEIIAHTGRVFLVGVQMAAPMMAVSFILMLIFSMLGRAAPQMNVFGESFGVRVLVGLAMFGLTSEILAQHIINYLRRLPEDMIRVARCLGPS